MRPTTYYLLATLLDGPKYGYEIMSRAQELSTGRVLLAAGTLYAALDRLIREGLIEAVREETVNGRHRRYYALTDAGDAAVRTEAQRMADAARVVTRLTAGRPAPAPRPAVKPA